MATGTKKLPDILTHFNLPDDLSGTFRAKCKHCPKSISGTTKVTTNWLKHMRNCHPSISLGKKTTDTEQTTLAQFTEKKYHSTDPRQVRTTTALLSFVAEDLLPLSVVESSGFRSFVSCLDPRYQVPSRKHFSTVLLEEHYQQLLTCVKDRLKNVTNLSVTMDMWSSRQMRSFTGITAHYIFNWKLESVILACDRCKGRHTSEKIYQEYENTMLRFGIAEKVKHVVTDTASNMVKAFNLPNYEDNKHDDLEEIDEDASSLDDDVSFDEITSNDSDMLYMLPVEHHGCFAHVLQLVVKDGFKRASQIGKVINKCSKIVSHVRKSTIARDSLDGEKTLKPAVATRWNSQLKMLRSIFAIPSDKLDSLDAPKLNTYECNVIKEVMEILTPFEEATDFAQVDNYPSSGYVLPCIRGLEHQLSKLVTRYHCSFVLALKESLTKRMAIYEEKNDYISAAVLDPRFKMLWCRDDLEKKAVETILITEMAKVNQPIVTNVTNQEPATSEPPAKKHKIFSYMDEDREAHDQSRSRSTDQKLELQKYLEEPCEDDKMCPLQYWKSKQSTFPSLAEIAQIVLGIPASSAPVERLFSIAGKVFRPERCKLSDKTFEKLMFIRCNDYVMSKK